MDRVNAAIQENLTAIRAVKAFVREEYEEEFFEKANHSLADTSRTTFHFAVLNLPAFQATMYTAIVLILWFGGNFIRTGQMQVGQLTGFLSYVLQIVNSLMLISNVFLMLTRSLASARRINQVFDECPDLSDPKDPVTEISDGRIDFEHVYFKYKREAQQYTLSDIDLHIRSGETVGIIGGTGSSKTTLVQLIPRLYDASGGRVLVGGSDVRSYSLCALRDAVGIVLQKNVLFPGRSVKISSGEIPTLLIQRFGMLVILPALMSLSAIFLTDWIPDWSRAALICPAGKSSGCVLPVLF